MTKLLALITLPVGLFLATTAFAHDAGSYYEIVPEIQIGGQYADAIHGGTVYVAQGARILTFAADQHSDLNLIHTTRPAPGAILSLARYDDLLYAAWRAGESGQIRIFELNEVGHPRFLKDFDYEHAYDFPAFPIALVVHDQTLYVSDSQAVLTAFDLSTPLVPEIGGWVGVTSSLAGGTAVLDQSKLLNWGQTGFSSVMLEVIDISTALEPQRLSGFAPAGLTEPDFQVLAGDKYAVMLGGAKYVVDLRHPTTPRSQATLGSFASTRGYLSGDVLLGGYEGAIHPWNLGNPANPIPLAAVTAPADGTRLIAQGPGDEQLTFFTDPGKLLTVDISDASRPVLAGVREMLPGSGVDAVTSTSGAVVLLDQQGRLQLFDSELSPLGLLAPESGDAAFFSVDVHDDTAVLLSAQGLHTVDLGVPEQPSLTASLALPDEIYSYSQISVGDQRGWILTPTVPGRLIEFDLSDPVKPRISHDLVMSASLMAHEAQHLYLVLAQENRLAVFSTNPGSPPEEVGSYSGCASIRALDVHENIAVILCPDGWRFLDVSAPDSPKLLGDWPASNPSRMNRQVRLDSQQAWLATDHGAELLDIANPAEPALLARYRLPGTPEDLTMADHGVWAALGDGGLALLETPTPVTRAHTAAWYHPERAGEGWMIEVLEDDKALGYWFTYDEHGQQSWMIGTGTVRANRILFEMETARGGRFGPQFNPADVEFTPAGQVRMVWTGCNRAWFEYLPDGKDKLVLDLERLSRTQGLEDCNNVEAPIDTAPANQSGSWYDPAQAGQGFTLQWLDTGDALVNWFTFDAQGNPYWMLGVGQAQGDAIVFPEITATRGASFGASFDPEDIEYFHWGELQVQLGCRTGTAEYNSVLPQFQAGSFDLERLTIPDGISCD